MLVLHVEYDQIVQLMHLVPTDSGLYTGLNKLEQCTVRISTVWRWII